MANESMTVEQACEKLQDQSLYNDSIEDDAWAIITDMCSKILATHKQELAAKDAEIKRLKEEVAGLQLQMGDDDLLKMANDIDRKDAEIAKLRALVKEMTDTLLSFLAILHNPCSVKQCREECSVKCREMSALVAKAREVVNG